MGRSRWTTARTRAARVAVAALAPLLVSACSGGARTCSPACPERGYNATFWYTCCDGECVLEDECVHVDAACGRILTADDVPCHAGWIDFPPVGVCCGGACTTLFDCLGTACVPEGRYTLVDPGTGVAGGPCPGSGCDGSGLVRDGTTGLVWSRYPYLGVSSQTFAEASDHCASLAMRVPTESEALGVAGSFDGCAWPLRWETYTSTSSASGNVVLVTWDGWSSSVAVDAGFPVLCVR
jgi:hypothetical protein